jgi:hypothetical protein
MNVDPDPTTIPDAELDIPEISAVTVQVPKIVCKFADLTRLIDDAPVLLLRSPEHVISVSSAPLNTIAIPVAVRVPVTVRIVWRVMLVIAL